MTYDFFADKKDKIEILEFIFRETDLHIYDLSSEYEQEICEYKTVEEIVARFDLENENYPFTTYQMWTPRHGGEPAFRKVQLDPNIVTDIHFDTQQKARD